MLTDIGANLGHDSFAGDFDAVLTRAADAGVSRIVLTGSCRASTDHAVDAARKSPTQAASPRLFATAGLHPHHATDWNEDLAGHYRQLATQRAVVALGEAGLDYHRNYSPHDAQQSAFAAQIDLAIEAGLPLFLHQRDAHADFLQLLDPALTRLPGAVVHCFTGTRAELADYIARDLYVGITGWICDERRGLHLLESVVDIPDDRLLIETDAPYLLPRTLRPRPKSRRCEPAHLREVARVIAAARGVSIEALAAQTRANAERLFGLSD
ncbi:MAG: TatD family hydrolase [Oceanococcaceae bacterium]